MFGGETNVKKVKGLKIKGFWEIFSLLGLLFGSVAKF
jgi:hypothetical protein